MGKLIHATAVVGLLSVGAAANAVLMRYEFSFTAEDMMSFATVNGADGTSAASNGLFDGARLRRDGSSGSGPLAARSYWASQNAAFSSWANSTTDKFLSFNLWGFNGNGANWGDDVKPTAWGTTEQPAGWTPTLNSWPWGTPPAGTITDKILGWDANSYADGVNFQDGDLASKKFTFQVDIESENAWWGQNTYGAPNDLSAPVLTLWFGGWFDNDYFEQDNNYYMYEGNMVLRGKEVGAVPEPFTVLIGVAGLGLAAFRKRLKK